MEHEHKLNTVLQTWNSMRLLSWLLSEKSPYPVDEKYVAVTGASGGGTQSLYMAMLDERVTAAVPVVMVSAYFNGDCKCENGVNALRTRGCRSNIAERAACFAPKPLLVISDGDDWTRRNPVDEYPYLRHVYALYDAQSRVENFHDLHGVHDYNLVKRQRALGFLLRQWGLPDTQYEQDAYTLRSVDELRTFGGTSGLERPEGYARSNEALYGRVITPRPSPGRSP